MIVLPVQLSGSMKGCNPVAIIEGELLFGKDDPDENRQNLNNYDHNADQYLDQGKSLFIAQDI